ncbi:MAG TPA: RdgB/HAM1 family non-canonical purine NTP pyrophosphatase [Burkholderiaceae bacterium]|nr:RdgB/HAM1 family non-canonical purine NTP pyrophosphatase [Burkholderiaceae bacterium]
MAVRRLVLASDNPGKQREFAAMLAPLGVELVAQGALGVRAADEPFHTFVENALAKARHASEETGLAAVADDSGVCCEALGGAPGVRSARFAGEGATDSQNNAEMIRRLQGIADRAAHYTCVLVAVRSPLDPDPVIADARWAGTIIDSPRGSNGFGYDPHFWLAEQNCTAAELAPEQKNRISHRGRALEELVGKLRRAWRW